MRWATSRPIRNWTWAASTPRHKLALLSSIAFGTQVDFDGIELEGIERISIEDIRAAADMGYRIKLLGVAQMTGRGLEQRMSALPCARTPRRWGSLEGGTNMVVLEGDAVGQIVLRGPGAGEGPTASAVMADVMRHRRAAAPARSSASPPHAQDGPRRALPLLPAPYYLRMALQDKPGALAKIAAVLGEAGVSIDRMRQYGHVNDCAPVLIVTHKTTRAALDGALGAMENTGVVSAVTRGPAH